MEQINMSDIPVRENKIAHFIIQNENVRIELETDLYKVGFCHIRPFIRLYLINKDGREIFNQFFGQDFTIIEINESGEFCYQGLTLHAPEFRSWKEEIDAPVTVLYFTKSY